LLLHSIHDEEFLQYLFILGFFPSSSPFLSYFNRPTRGGVSGSELTKGNFCNKVIFNNTRHASQRYAPGGFLIFGVEN
ncbi:MAG: hypothetical protein ACYDBP_07305, partial [Leptospirales bacterium]